MMPPRRLAVIGHVEWVELGRVAAFPRPGDIVHLDDPITFPGGGGGVAFAQLSRSPAEVHFFTAFGSGSSGDAAARALLPHGRVYGARRDELHPRAVVLVTPDGERTIVVVGAPLHARRADPLPWELLASCDGVYFTGEDADALRAARAARVLVVTARRRLVLVESGICADVVVGSAHDPREASALANYPVAPRALVLTEGARGGTLETATGVERFAAPPPPALTGAAYGAGDSFAAALTWYLAAGLDLPTACARSGPHGAAVLRGLDPRSTQLALQYP